MKNLRLFLCSILVFGLSATALSKAIESRAGTQDGSQSNEQGYLVVPVPIDSNGSSSSPLGVSLDGCEVRLAVDKDQDVELGYACGEWFVPPPDRYKLWIDGPTYVSPFQSIVSFSGSRGLPTRHIEMVVCPAGQLAVAEAAAKCGSCTMRVIHLESHLVGGYLRNEFTRRADLTRATAGIPVPAGKVVAGLFDNVKQRYVALSRIIDVPERERVVWNSDAASTGQSLILVLERPQLLSLLEEDDVELVVHPPDAEAVDPDVLVRAAGRLVAIWFDIEERRLVLEVQSERVYIPQAEIRLSGTGVAREEHQLVSRPSLQATLDLATELEPEELIVRARSDRASLRTVALRPDQRMVVIPHLPPIPLWIELRCADWTFFEPADLSSGLDERVHISRLGFSVEGTLFLGEEEHPGRITFFTGGEQQIAVAADADGRYLARLFKKRKYIIQADPDGSNGPPYRMVEKLSGDTRLDINVPDSQLTARVIDTKSGIPVAGATVVADNISQDGDQEATSSHVLETNTDGEVLLPPLLRGRLRLNARAEGYIDSGWQEHGIGDSKEGTFEVLLEPIEESQRVTVLLADGRPAARAEARLHSSLTSNALPLWSASVAADGILEIPLIDQPRFLLIRHEQAASAVIPCRTSRCECADTIGLGEPGPPLVIRAIRVNGEPARFAEVALWTPGGWIARRPLAWLYGAAHTVTGTDGLWRARGIPRAAFRAAAWKGSTGSELAPIWSMATDVPFPWPAPVELTLVNE